MTEHTKLTKGPWQVSGVRFTCEAFKGHGVGPDNEDYVVVVPYYDRAHGECLANARLISAAPALYEALEHVSALLADICKDEKDDPSVGITGWTECHEAVASARAALSSACGSNT